jgi:hypothetical protein
MDKGLTMSPLMVMVSFMQPKELLVSVTGGGAETTATGLPSLIINKGFFVFLTFCNKDKQVVLNFEMVTVSITKLH